MKESPLHVKSKMFALRIVNFCNHLKEAKKEFNISNQLFRSGTSIGANISEALQGQSKRDFLAKMSIALKEASETVYWLRLLKETGYLSDKQQYSILKDCIELVKLLTSIVRTTNNTK